MRYIALFFPAILSVGIEYRNSAGKGWFEYLYKYAFYLICNVLLTQSLISYVLKIGAVTIDAFDSFPFFTKYLLIAVVFAVIMPYICKVVKANISISFEVKKDRDNGIDSAGKNSDR